MIEKEILKSTKKPEDAGRMPKLMTSDAYSLVEPYRIVKETITTMTDEDSVIVNPVVAGICGSDVLYFKGDKDPEKMHKRMPLVPLHEGVVRNISTGRLGSVIPFKNCGKCSACLNRMENLCENSEYMGSSAPGLARSKFAYPGRLIVDVPDGVPIRIAAVLEPLSIVFRMLEETEPESLEKVAVIGTGLLGRIVAIFLSLLREVSKDKILLIGRKDSRLAKFHDICETANLTKTSMDNLRSKFSLTVEAVGGRTMAHTLSQAIAMTRPKGSIHIFGLADDLEHINVTKIVAKGLNLRGFSRARASDYHEVMGILHANKKLRTMLELAIDESVFIIKNEYDLMDAFHYAVSGNNDGRVIVSFEEEEN